MKNLDYLLQVAIEKRVEERLGKRRERACRARASDEGEESLSNAPRPKEADDVAPVRDRAPRRPDNEA